MACRSPLPAHYRRRLQRWLLCCHAARLPLRARVSRCSSCAGGAWRCGRRGVLLLLVEGRRRGLDRCPWQLDCNALADRRLLCKLAVLLLLLLPHLFLSRLLLLVHRVQLLLLWQLLVPPSHASICLCLFIYCRLGGCSLRRPTPLAIFPRRLALRSAL